MRTVDDLITWLRAQLDDDERVAREAGSRALAWPANGTWYLEGVEHNVVGQEEAFCHPHNVDHIARHDPARVLAEVDAKRRIVDEHNDPISDGRTLRPGGETIVCGTCHQFGNRDERQPWPCETLRLLALPYADRPGYREEWLP